MDTKPTSQFQLPKENASWHFERILKPDDKTIDNYVLIQPGPADIMKVLQAYFHHPVPGYNIASIEIVYNEQLNRVFFGNMKMMNARKGNVKYVPSWRNTVQGKERQHRESIDAMFKLLSDPYQDSIVPNVKLLPLWHGTQDEVADYIFNMGYGIFTSSNLQFVTDEGYFGKGVYTAHEAEYTYRCYAQKHGEKAVLLLNWVSSFEAYPVTSKDMANLNGRLAGYDQCDAHFIPVRSDQHPNTTVYIPCGWNQAHQYMEMVVFSPSQCLPRYRIKLVASQPKPGIEQSAEDSYQMGLDCLGLGQYGMVSECFENALVAGHPGAAIRLHWLHTGESGVVEANLLKAQTYINIPIETINYLKTQSHFKGKNDKESQFNLGWCYQQGLGINQDLGKAAKYYWIAASQGHKDAQYQLGVCCASGVGVEKNIDRAVYYYQKAAEQNHMQAHYVLSQCYALGLGVTADSAKSLFHQQAAQKGNHPKLAGLPLLPQPTTTACNHPAEIAQLRDQLKQQEISLTTKEQVLQTKNQALQQEKLLTQQKEIALKEKTAELQQKIQKERQDHQMIMELEQSVVNEKAEKATLQTQMKDHQQTLHQQSQKLVAQEQRLSEKEIALGKSEAAVNLLKMELKQAQDQLAKVQTELEQLKQRPNLPPRATHQSGGFWSSTQTDLSEVEQVKAKSESVAHQVNLEDAQALGKWVSDGHLIEVEKLLRKNNNLAYVIISITDRSDRTFKCTGFQYAVWALDFEMCEVFRKYLDNPNAALQIKALEKEPEKYSQHGAHYDMTGLINKTQTYVSNFDSWDTNQCCQYWQKEVGGEQRKCPAWLIYAWSEEGKDVAWVKKDFVNCKVIRRYDRSWLDWWFTHGYNSGRGVGASMARVRGPRAVECGGGFDEAERFGSAFRDLQVIQCLKGITNESVKKLTADVNQNLGHPALPQLKQPSLLPKAEGNPTGGFWSLPSPNSMLQSEVEQVKAKSESIVNQVKSQDAQGLAKWVSDGHLLEVDKLLQKDNNLAHVIIRIKDRSDRTFNCTGFQYAVWALDFEMCEVFRKYLDNPNAALQIKALEKEPKKYSRYGAHYDMTGLTEKIQTYDKNSSRQGLNSNLWTPQQCCEYWQKEVGREQRNCPAWLVYAWCEKGTEVSWLSVGNPYFTNQTVNRDYFHLNWWFGRPGAAQEGVGAGGWAALRGCQPSGACEPSVSAFKWTGEPNWLTVGAMTTLQVKVHQDVDTTRRWKKSRLESLEKLKASVNQNSYHPMPGFTK
jgi:TPR repeat protein